MDELTTHLSFYAVLVMMLLGAFLIGYFFGSRSKKVLVVKTEQVPVPLSPATQTPTESSEVRTTRNPSGRIEIDELSSPGPIRALKTRERSGSLSSDAKSLIVEDKLDFSTMGRGDVNKKDDLQKIVGIGPFVEEKLNEIGIYNYSQLANMTEEDTNGVTQLIEFFPGRIQRDDWVGQAAVLGAEKKKKK